MEQNSNMNIETTPTFEPHLRSRFLVKFGGFFEEITSFTVHSIEMGMPYKHSNAGIGWSNITFTMYDAGIPATAKVIVNAVNAIEKAGFTSTFPCEIRVIDVLGTVDFTYEAVLSFISANLDLYSWSDNNPRKEIKLVCGIESITTK